MTPFRRSAARAVAAVLLPAALLGLAGCVEEGDDITIVEAPPEDLVEGLDVQIEQVTIPADRRPIVHYSLVDDAGTPVTTGDLDGPPGFVIAFIEEDPDTGLTRYQSYLVEDVAGEPYEREGVTEAPALASATQVVSDDGGLNEEIEPGKFRYTFGAELPAGFDTTATHTVATWVTREDRRFVANGVFSFVPDGSELQTTRDIAPTSACNECHAPLEAHGGSRREVGLCVICHTDQTIDPETGETLDFKDMVHRLHTGAELTDLPYFIVGRNQNVDDYSTVVFPQDRRNCEKCHKDAPDADNWRQRPSRSACGACHDDVDFATGAGHSGGIVQVDDTLCTECHRDVQVIEFDQSVPGSHLLPYQSTVNPDLTLAITGVAAMTPGSQPSVRFTVSDDSGAVDITSLNRAAIVFAGPTSDYAQLLASNNFTIQGGGAIGTLVENAPGDYTFTPDGYAIPADATGTWSVGLEARTQSIPAGSESVQFGANNPVVDVDLASGTLVGGAPAARRTVVSEENCNVCHDDLRFHGNLRTEIPYCVLCHNLYGNDEEDRPDVDPDTNPPETIDFKVMVHRIHRGEELANPYIVYGFNSSLNDFSEVLYPGDLNRCDACHEDDTQLLPGPAGRGATVLNIAGTPVNVERAILPPTNAACTSCHDSESALTHVALNSVITDDPAIYSESCDVCHAEGRDAAVSASHAVE